MTSSQLGVGVVGLGIGTRHLETILASPMAYVAGICDFDSEKLIEAGRLVPDAFQTKNSSDLINDSRVDVVVLASYDSAHGGQVIEALKAGKKVFADKPLCTSEEELEAIIHELQKKPTSSLSTNMPLRSRNNFVELKKLVTSGFFGKLYLIEADYLYGRLNKLTEGWRGRDPGYSVTLGGGIHMIDLIMWLTNSRVREVSAFGTALATKNKLTFGNADTEIANLRLDGGLLARVSSNFPVVSPHHHRVALFGTERTYLIDSLGESYTERRGTDFKTVRMHRDVESEFRGDSLRSFLASITGERQAIVSTSDALWSAHVGLGIKRSIAHDSVEPIARLTGHP